jgi:hypothetical protein
MSELRQRPRAGSPARPSPDDADVSPVPEAEKGRRQGSGGYDWRGEEESHSVSFLDVLRVLVTLVIVLCGISYYTTSSESLLWGYRPWFTRWPVVMRYLVCTSATNLHICTIGNSYFFWTSVGSSGLNGGFYE